MSDSSCSLFGTVPMCCVSRAESSPVQHYDIVHRIAICNRFFFILQAFHNQTRLRHTRTMRATDRPYLLVTNAIKRCQPLCKGVSWGRTKPARPVSRQNCTLPTEAASSQLYKCREIHVSPEKRDENVDHVTLWEQEIDR